MEFGAWYGIFAPAKTPAAVLDKLNVEFLAATRDPEVRKQLEAAGFVVNGVGRADFARLVRTDTERWGRVANAAGLTAK